MFVLCVCVNICLLTLHVTVTFLRMLPTFSWRTHARGHEKGNTEAVPSSPEAQNVPASGSGGGCDSPGGTREKHECTGSRGRDARCDPGPSPTRLTLPKRMGVEN